MDEINKEHLTELRAELQNERKLKSQKVEEVENLKTVQEDLEQDKTDITTKHDKLVHFIATILAWVVILLIIPFLLLLLVINTFPSFTDVFYFKIVAFIVLAILSLAGFSIPKCKAWAVSKIETLIKKKFS